jgi:hypothetical protein
MKLAKTIASSELTIVFVSEDPTQQHVWDPLRNLAASLGFKVSTSYDGRKVGDIGFYCGDEISSGHQSINVVTINGLDQDHVIRPNYVDFFRKENWVNFDFGFLPGPRWFRGFKQAQKIDNVSPKFGVSCTGWPKSDYLFANGDPGRKKIADRPVSRILYAPQTEQDGKQSSLLSQLDLNRFSLKIKHWESDRYRQIYPWLITDAYMANLEKENENASSLGAQIIDPESNFIDLLRDTDILITDQSSVLYEAMLCGIPTIVIEGWKHACGNCAGPQPSPDATLVSGIDEINAVLHYAETHYRKLQRLQLKNRRKNFTNLGNASNTTLSKVIGLWQSMTNSRVLYGR